MVPARRLAALSRRLFELSLVLNESKLSFADMNIKILAHHVTLDRGDEVPKVRGSTTQVYNYQRAPNIG